MRAAALAVAMCALATPLACGTRPIDAAPTGDPGARRTLTTTYANARGGWSVEMPADWNASDDGSGTTFRSYDERTLGLDRAAGTLITAVPAQHVKVTVVVVRDATVRSGAEAADEHLTAPAPGPRPRLIARDDGVALAGWRATELVLEFDAVGGARQAIRRYLFTTPDRRLFWIDVNPHTGQRDGEVTVVLRSLAVR